MGDTHNVRVRVIIVCTRNQLSSKQHSVVHFLAVELTDKFDGQIHTRSNLSPYRQHTAFHQV